VIADLASDHAPLIGFDRQVIGSGQASSWPDVRETRVSDLGTNREQEGGMLNDSPSSPPSSTVSFGASSPGIGTSSADLLFSVLESAEAGVVVIDPAGRAVYMNSSARALLESPLGILPDWIVAQVPALTASLARAQQVVERWVQGDMVLRARVRPLDRFTGLAVLELTVAQSGGQRQLSEQLSRALQLTISDAKLLALLWRGLSNDEVAQNLGVRVGTVKSRLFRLYLKLGVKRRSAAVLRAAEVLQG
jgi:DNA-binding NarL/FixJ family response regulator